MVFLGLTWLLFSLAKHDVAEWSRKLQEISSGRRCWHKPGEARYRDDTFSCRTGHGRPRLSRGPTHTITETVSSLLQLLTKNISEEKFFKKLSMIHRHCHNEFRHCHSVRRLVGIWQPATSECFIVWNCKATRTRTRTQHTCTTRR